MGDESPHDAFTGNQRILTVITGVFGEDNTIAGFNGAVSDMLNLNRPGPETKRIGDYVLSVSEDMRTLPEQDRYVEYKISTPANPLAITYLRNYAMSGGTHTSTWAIYGYETDREAAEGTLTLYKSYQQFYQADGAQVGTQPLGYADSQFSQLSEPSSDEMWDDTIQRTLEFRRRVIRYGGRRRKTRHRRRKTHRRKTRRSRR
jgi:hypothetical protein